jgi:hypothetical protein
MNFTRKAAAIPVALILSQALAANAQTPGHEGRRICRVPETTATRMAPPRICKTAAEWRAIDNLRERQAETEGQIFSRERVESQPPAVASPN